MLVLERAVANLSLFVHVGAGTRCCKSTPVVQDLGACESFTKDVQLSGEKVRWVLCGGMAA